MKVKNPITKPENLAEIHGVEVEDGRDALCCKIQNAYGLLVKFSHKPVKIMGGSQFSSKILIQKTRISKIFNLIYCLKMWKVLL